MRLSVLGSGSKGNCSVVWTERSLLFVDAGALTTKYIEPCLEALGLSPSSSAGLVVTHAHRDHIDLTTYHLCRKFSIPVWVSRRTWEVAIAKTKRLRRLEQDGLVRFFNRRTLEVGEFRVRPFRVPHSVEENVGTPVGFEIESADQSGRIVYLTDLGHVPARIVRRMAEADVIVIEANHDVAMERNSARVPSHKDWVLSERGHLSNEQAGRALAQALKDRNGESATVVLVHLSEECNTPELALSTVQAATHEIPGIRFLLSSQRNPTPPILVRRVHA